MKRAWRFFPPLSLRSRVALLAALLLLTALFALGIATLGVTEVQVDRFLVAQASAEHQAKLAKVRTHLAELERTPISPLPPPAPAPPSAPAPPWVAEADGLPAGVLADVLVHRDPDAAWVANLAEHEIPVVLARRGKVVASAERTLVGAEVRRLADGAIEMKGPGTQILLRGEPVLLPDQPDAELWILPAPPPPPALERVLVDPIRRGVIAILLAVATVGVFLAFALARRLTGPLEALTHAVRRMEQGDLNVRVAIPRGSDEVGSLAEAFNAMAERLGRVESARRKMVSDIAHELRAPLTAIRCDLEALQDGLRPLSLDQVDLLHRETLALAGLVDDLQELALFDAGQIRLDLQRLELGAWLDEQVLALVSQASQRGVGWVVHPRPEPIWAQLDPRRLGQALRNVLVNALAQAPEGSSIEVAAQELGPETARWYCLEVVDHGPGIAPEHRARIFDRFYRVDPSRNRATGGSGLGLSIAKALMEAHGGDIEVRETPGGGATFRLTWPAR